MKIVLAGSPEISVKAFEKVINNFDVVAVITQPDKKRGRGMELSETPVSSLANKYNIKTFKPNKVIEIYQELADLDFDILLTFAFGKWIPTKVLKLGKYPPINIHGSLLPDYRGAAPLHWAILDGKKEIGITLMEMIKEMDAGNIFYKASKEIDEFTTTGDAFKIAEDLAESNIVGWLKKYIEEKPQGIEQGDVFTIAPKITKEFSEIKESDSIEIAKRKIVGLNPFPGAYIMIEGKRVKLFRFSNENVKNSLKIKLSNGELNVIEYRREGKKTIKV